MGFILGRLEQHDEALQHKLKSLALSLDYYKKALDNHKDDIKHIISCLMDISSDYNSLGQTYCALGCYDTSLECLNKSLKLRTKYLPSNDYAFALSFESFGDTYLAIATPESLLQAEDYYAKTRRIFVEEYRSEEREDVRRLDEKLSQCREQIDINQQL
jgi:tetratricopeptide (TPR) repeat protein